MGFLLMCLSDDTQINSPFMDSVLVVQVEPDLGTNKKQQFSEAMLLAVVTDRTVTHEGSVHSAKNIARFLRFVGLS